MARSSSDSPPLFDLTVKPDFSFERKAMKRGLWPLAGLDEAGRGPLAGPVVAAAVILNPKRIPDGLDDSKRLTAEARETLFSAILGTAIGVSVASVSATGIDRINILRASLEAMRRAFCGLHVKPLHALVDGRDVPPGLACGAEALVKGDQRSQSIAAASIVAKVMRDRMMENCGRLHARYGFESHMGYATQRHRDAIGMHGALPRLHRVTFAPFRIETETAVEMLIEA
ncbi:ribonuclease HII [Mesorhizobium sp. LHD-90]|uniref:ribonuclease HII n=1 Tax=Mesorhizobium sp. LHD-90 TaxID=3071414 RepID=UPI0027E1E7DB|nr:ribonuclease HII [Mesorhizobium sp. LHD-90]MDQ6436040.1 ribonuclease HII [Mesorhizobium sp. LHD-90]